MISDAQIELILSEKALTGGKVAKATLTSGKAFAARENRFAARESFCGRLSQLGRQADHFYVKVCLRK